MKLENEYVVMYEATREDIGEKRFYASKILQGVEEKMLISYNAESGEYIDLSQFKLIYTDKEQKHLMGSLKNVPTEEDIHLSIYDVDGNLVFGCNDVPPVPPTPKHIVTVNPIENCVTGGSGEYEEGANVKVTIKPAEGYMFGDGNEPKIGEDYMNLDEGQGWFYKDIVMGTEDIEVTIEGVVVEAIPEPLKPAIRMYCIANKEVGLDEGDVKVVEEPIPTDYIQMPDSELTDGFYRFAIDVRLGEVSAIYQKGVEPDIKDDFFTRATELVEFEGQQFVVYNGNDNTSISLDEFKFVF